MSVGKAGIFSGLGGGQSRKQDCKYSRGNNFCNTNINLLKTRDTTPISILLGFKFKLPTRYLQTSSVFVEGGRVVISQAHYLCPYPPPPTITDPWPLNSH